MALEQAGVRAVVREPGRHGGHAGAFEVHVAETDLPEATAILDAAEVSESSLEESGSYKCPSCGFVSEPLREGGRLICQVCGAAE